MIGIENRGYEYIEPKTVLHDIIYNAILIPYGSPLMRKKTSIRDEMTANNMQIE
jgi:hypothetical protein